jgi:hypothetical protein
MIRYLLSYFRCYGCGETQNGVSVKNIVSLVRYVVTLKYKSDASMSRGASNKQHGTFTYHTFLHLFDL